MIVITLEILLIFPKCDNGRKLNKMITSFGKPGISWLIYEN
jgi:hypothetical protein